MALVIGGVFVGALIVYDNLSSHSDYSDYDDYSDYSDYEERRKRKIRSMKDDARVDAKELSNYKDNSINPELSNNTLISQSAMRVSVPSMDSDVKGRINAETAEVSDDETAELRAELDEIEKLMRKINNIKKEDWQ